MELGLKRAEPDLFHTGTPLMAKSGPENYQTTEVVPFGSDRRLRPPDTLGDGARRIFTELVGSLPSGHFKAGDISLLCRYCEMAAVAEEAAFQMAQPGGMVTTDGKVSPWFSIHASATKSMGALAPRLRLGPLSRAKQQSKRAVQPLSVYDEMRAQRDWDKLP
jgi:phage terminase small subunit